MLHNEIPDSNNELTARSKANTRNLICSTKFHVYQQKFAPNTQKSNMTKDAINCLPPDRVGSEINPRLNMNDTPNKPHNINTCAICITDNPESARLDPVDKSHENCGIISTVISEIYPVISERQHPLTESSVLNINSRTGISLPLTESENIIIDKLHALNTIDSNNWPPLPCEHELYLPDMTLDTQQNNIQQPAPILKGMPERKRSKLIRNNVKMLHREYFDEREQLLQGNSSLSNSSTPTTANDTPKSANKYASTTIQNNESLAQYPGKLQPENPYYSSPPRNTNQHANCPKTKPASHSPRKTLILTTPPGHENDTRTLGNVSGSKVNNCANNVFADNNPHCTRQNQLRTRTGDTSAAAKTNHATTEVLTKALPLTSAQRAQDTNTVPCSCSPGIDRESGNLSNHNTNACQYCAQSATIYANTQNTSLPAVYFQSDNSHEIDNRLFLNHGTSRKGNSEELRAAELLKESLSAEPNNLTPYQLLLSDLGPPKALPKRQRPPTSWQKKQSCADMSNSLRRKYVLLVLWNVALTVCAIAVGVLYRTDLQNANLARRDGEFGMSTLYDDMGFYPMGGVLTLCASCLFDVLCVSLIVIATLLKFGYERNYARLLIIDFFVTTTSVVMLQANQPDAIIHLNNYFNSSMRKMYRSDHPAAMATKYVDIIQQEGRCCGLTNATDWQKSQVWRSQDIVPISCCEKERNTIYKTCELDSAQMFQDACLDKPMQIFGLARRIAKLVAIMKLVVILADIVTSALIFREVNDQLMDDGDENSGSNENLADEHNPNAHSIPNGNIQITNGNASQAPLGRNGRVPDLESESHCPQILPPSYQQNGNLIHQQQPVYQVSYQDLLNRCEPRSKRNRIGTQNNLSTAASNSDVNAQQRHQQFVAVNSERGFHPDTSVNTEDESPSSKNVAIRGRKLLNQLDRDYGHDILLLKGDRQESQLL